MAYKHQPLTREQLASRREQETQVVDPAIDPTYKVFRPKEGRNYIRFLPPTWTGFRSWDYDILMHRNIGPDNGSYLCLRMIREPCPICEERQALDNDGDTEAAKQIYARKTRVAWILDRKDNDNNPKVWVYGYTISEDIARRLYDERTGQEIDMLHPDEGFDVSFVRTKVVGERGRSIQKTESMEIDRKPSPIDEDIDWQNFYLNFIEKHPVPDVLKYYEYEHIAKVLHGRNTARRETDQREYEEPQRTSRGAPPPIDRETREPEVDPDDRREPRREPEEEPARTGRRTLPPEDDRRGDDREPARTREPERVREPEREPDREEPRTTRRTLPPEDAEPPRTTRRTLPPEEPEAPRGNGHDAREQAGEAVRNLRPPPRDEEPARGRDRDPDPPRGGRRAPPDDDRGRGRDDDRNAAPATRRRPPAP